MRRTSAWVAIRELPGVGERILARLQSQASVSNTSPESVLAASPEHLARFYRLPTDAIRRLISQRSEHMDRCRRIVDQLDRVGARALSPDSPGFPSRFHSDLRHTPPLIFTLGNRTLLNSPCLAILSSREILEDTVQAIVTAIRTARTLNLVLAVGGMKTTHRLAAISARAINANRIVVLDRGLFTAFNGDYRRDPFGSGVSRTVFDRDTALALSPFRPEDHAAPNNGRRRDELIAALGHVIFVTSARKGGTVESICLEALSRGKPVLLWDPGNTTLLRRGAMRLDRLRFAATLRRVIESHGAVSVPLRSRPLPTPRQDREP